MKHLIIIFAAALAACCGGQKQPQAAATPFEPGQTVTLASPDAVPAQQVVEALRQRCSTRAFSGEQLTLEELSGILWAAAGVNREDGKLTAPSAMALYPIRTYAFLADGIYFYNAAQNTLERVAEGDHRAATGGQPFVATAPLNIVYVADISTYAERNVPLEHTRYLCGQDAAGYAENASLYGAACGLKSVVRGSFDNQAILGLLGLDPQTHFTALAQTVGK